MFQEMWDKQSQLMKKFDKIETDHNLMQIPLEYPLNLDCKFYQARLRDFSQRTICEMAEATEALSFKTWEEYEEELADTYHFLLELMIFSGIPQNQVFSRDGQDLPELFLDVESEFDKHSVHLHLPAPESYIREYAYDFVEKLMLAINELKKKPWKSNHDNRDTDVKQFYNLLADAHYDFICVCFLSGIEAEDLYESYIDKQEMNEQRIAGGE